MKTENSDAIFNKYKETIDTLNPCMNDFLYVYDLVEDHYHISSSAMQRFSISTCDFSNVGATHKEFVYAEDYGILMDEIQDIIDGKKNFHDCCYRWMGKDGNPIWINCRGVVIFNDAGIPNYLVGCINEIGKSQMADNVTGLLGIDSLLLERERDDFKRIEGFAMRVGIDNFKEINERKGFEFGNQVLRHFGDALVEILLPGQKLYRRFSDEFSVIDNCGRSVEDALELYNAICNKLNQVISEMNYEVFFTVSAGVVNLNEQYDQKHDNLVQICEFALGQAKRLGRNRVYVFKQEDYDTFMKKKELLRKLRKSVANNFEGFQAYYQPIVDAKTGKLLSAETLLRFFDEDDKMISPGEFIPLLEESYLIIPVGRWVMQQAMETCKSIRKMLPDFRISFNLSNTQIMKSDVLGQMTHCLNEVGVDPNAITVELTESKFLEEDVIFINFCEGLNQKGMQLALDDFGTGYSNFSYLYSIHPYSLKIDRSFTVKALNNEKEYEILNHMIEMCHCIDVKLCIEGIETKDELQMINRISPDYIQGFYFGKPCPYDSFVEAFVK